MGTKNNDCGCDEWAKATPQINSALFQTQNHGMGKYTGKPFIYCPWCGTKILGENDVAAVEPHNYVPSAMHMGDCDICGQVEDSPLHKSVGEK